MQGARGQAGHTMRWGVAIRALTQVLAVPQGFTLSVAGTLTATIGHYGHPGFLAVWLFVAGSGVGFCTMALATSAHRTRPPSGAPVLGAAILNIAPVFVVPAAVAVSWWLKPTGLSFFIAGLVAMIGYISWLGAYVLVVRRLTSHADGVTVKVQPTFDA